MAKDIKFNLKFDSNGQTVMGELTLTAKQLANAVGIVKKRAESSSDSLFKLLNAMSSAGFVAQNAVYGLEGMSSGFRGFDQAMRAANTMAGKSGKDFEALKGSVDSLSRSIPLARTELAEGLYQVVSNGVHEENWISFLEQSAKASVGGIAELGQVVNVTSTLIKNYGLEWDAAAGIQDKIQMTAKNGVTSFSQLAQALPKVAANANTLGVSIDELMAAFATLTGVSGNTAEVSTQLAAIFTALIKPSSEASQLAAEMGSITSNMWCIYIMHPKSFVFNFWGAVHSWLILICLFFRI